MHIVTKAQVESEIELALRQVFVSGDYCKRPFSPNVVERRIIYPCKCYVKSISASAIVAAATHVGDEGCYIYKFSRCEPICCYVPLVEFVDGYAGEPGSAKLIGSRLGINVYGEEVCIFSPKGLWGIMTTMEWFGLLGGTASFLQILQQQTPKLDEQVYGFLEHLRLLNVAVGRNHNISQNEYLSPWLPSLFAHIYGNVKSTQMLEQFESSPIGYWQIS